MSDTRVKNYLRNYKFRSNNIEFRIKSSKALEKFKNAQSFQLSELVSGKFHFAQERREILLLEYDIVTRWLLEVENSIIETSVIDVDLFLELAMKGHDKINQTIAEYPEKFDGEFTKIFTDSHSFGFKKFVGLIETLDTSSIFSYYAELVDLTISVMEHTLIEIHELNNIIGKKHKLKKNDDGLYICETNPNIYLTTIAVECFKNHGFSITKTRIEMYQNFFIFDEIAIKNMSSIKVCEDVLDNIESIIKVDYKGSV